MTFEATPSRHSPALLSPSAGPSSRSHSHGHGHTSQCPSPSSQGVPAVAPHSRPAGPMGSFAARQSRMVKRTAASLFPLIAASVMAVLLFARMSDQLAFGRIRRSSNRWAPGVGPQDEEEQLIGVLDELSKGGKSPPSGSSSSKISELSSGEGLLDANEVIRTQQQQQQQGSAVADPGRRKVLVAVETPDQAGLTEGQEGGKGVLREPGAGSEGRGTGMEGSSGSGADTRTGVEGLEGAETLETGSTGGQDTWPGKADPVPSTSAAAPAPSPAVEVAPCEPKSERYSRIVRNNIRKMVRRIPLPVLKNATRESLGAPCSEAWRFRTWQYFKKRPWTRRPGPTVHKGLDRICGNLRNMLGSIDASEDAEEAEKGALEVCKDNVYPRRNASADGSGRQDPQGGGKAGLRPKDLHDWGYCWPNQQPYSPRVQRYLGDLVRSSRRNTSERPSFGGIKFKFLVMGYTVEQLSKGKIHLTEAARLARYSNRILVLPRASFSRLSLARSLPVCNYLSLEHLVEHGVDWISPDVFLLLLSRYVPRRPSASFLCLETKSLWRPCAGYSEVAAITEDILAYTYWTPPSWNSMVSLDLPWAPFLSPAKAQAALKKWDNVDIVVYMKTTPSLLGFIRPGSPILADGMLPYAPHLHARVDSLVQRLGWPFVALHFRSEFVVFTLGNMNKSDQIVQQMQQCTQQAALLAMRVAARIGAKSIFIAADIPWRPYVEAGANSTGNAMGTPAAAAVPVRSESWGTMVGQFGRSRSLDAAEEALRYLRGRIPGSYMLDELDPQVNDLDPGEMSILDKLMCAHADAFLAGIKMCGGLRAYDGDIVRQRAALHKSPSSVFRWGNDK